MSDPCHPTLIRHTLCHYMNSKAHGSLEQPTRPWPAEPLPSAAAETMFQWVPVLPWGVGAHPRNPCPSLRDPASWLLHFHPMLWTLGLTSIPKPIPIHLSLFINACQEPLYTTYWGQKSKDVGRARAGLQMLQKMRIWSCGKPYLLLSWANFWLVEAPFNRHFLTVPSPHPIRDRHNAEGKGNERTAGQDTQKAFVYKWLNVRILGSWGFPSSPKDLDSHASRSVVGGAFHCLPRIAGDFKLQWEQCFSTAYLVVLMRAISSSFSSLPPPPPPLGSVCVLLLPTPHCGPLTSLVV